MASHTWTTIADRILLLADPQTHPEILASDRARLRKAATALANHDAIGAGKQLDRLEERTLLLNSLPDYVFDFMDRMSAGSG
jgi:hypothetical protein